MGRLFEKEYCVISELMESPEKPCVFVLGGSKISDAFIMMETVLKSGSADVVLTGGLAGNILLHAVGRPIGKGSVDYIYAKNYEEYIEKARVLYEQYPEKIILPVDIAGTADGKRVEYTPDTVPEDFTAIDIGSETIRIYCDYIAKAKTVFVNGPMGVFEETLSEDGTKKIFEALGETAGYTVVGGGDSVTAAKKYKVTDKLGYVCTGGGALIRFLTGEELPVVKALRYAAKHHPAR